MNKCCTRPSDHPQKDRFSRWQYGIRWIMEGAGPSLTQGHGCHLNLTEVKRFIADQAIAEAVGQVLAGGIGEGERARVVDEIPAKRLTSHGRATA